MQEIGQAALLVLALIVLFYSVASRQPTPFTDEVPQHRMLLQQNRIIGDQTAYPIDGSGPKITDGMAARYGELNLRDAAFDKTQLPADQLMPNTLMMNKIDYR